MGGLMDYRARFYSPYLNRFLQPDTLIPDAQNPQAWNRFSYVRNNPILYNDPTGHNEDCGIGENCRRLPRKQDQCPINHPSCEEVSTKTKIMPGFSDKPDVSTLDAAADDLREMADAIRDDRWRNFLSSAVGETAVYGLGAAGGLLGLKCGYGAIVCIPVGIAGGVIAGEGASVAAEGTVYADAIVYENVSATLNTVAKIAGSRGVTIIMEHRTHASLVYTDPNTPGYVYERETPMDYYVLKVSGQEPIKIGAGASTGC
jgi:RHS repeat-associated protein